MPAPKDPVKYAEYCKKISDANRRRSKESYDKVGFALRGKSRSEETRLRISTGQMGKKRPGYIDRLSEETRKRLSDANKGKHRSEENRRKISDGHKGKPKSEEHKKKISESKIGSPSPRKGAILSDETKEKLRDKRIGMKASGETRLKMSETRIGGFWYGNVIYDPEPQYCEKFDQEFRERVRAFFGYTCQFPGCGHHWRPGEKRLAVHHINYRKDACCNEMVKRLFVPVCPGACHAKTNNNRKEWEEYFTEFLMREYDGECYLSKEQLRNLKKSSLLQPAIIPEAVVSAA